jgi:5-formyltetrahydrofolate cyclo-ligase
MDNEAFKFASKSDIRKHLREVLANMTPADRHAKSLAACNQIVISPEFQSAKTIMLFLSTPMEVDTATLALRAWQQGKSVVVPKMSWDAKRMVPIEITSLSGDQLKTGEKGIREPISGNPVPLSFIDLIFVPGLGFTEDGLRIGRGMGFYDRFLAQNEFLGDSCGLCFEEQILPFIPMLDHDVPLSMLATDRGIRRVGKPHIAH